MPAKAKPSPKPPSKVACVADAIDLLERRRRLGSMPSRKEQGRRGDLDLNGIR